MSFLSKYGVARHVRIPLMKAGTTNHAVGADWTPSAGDVKISKDGGAAANVTNLPTAIVMGNSTIWDFSLTATEMQAAEVVITIADSVTKAVEDDAFSIETYGNASAQHAFDLGTASTAQTGDSFARLGAPAGASVSADVAGVKAVLPTALTADGNIKADALKVGGGAPETAATIVATMDSSAPNVNVTQLNGDAAAAADLAAGAAFLDAAVSGVGGACETAITNKLPAITSAISAIVVEKDALGADVTFLESQRLQNAIGGPRSGFGTTQPILKSLDGTKARVTGANADGVGNVPTTTMVLS